MALGKYTVPSDLTASEKEATNIQLDPDFAYWVQRLVDDARDAGYDCIQLADESRTYDYQAAVRAERRGNDTYKKNAAFFCRGLAWEYSWANGDSNQDARSLRKAMDWVDKNKSKYGLDNTIVLDKSTSTTKTRFFKPREVVASDDAAQVMYEGDDNSTGMVTETSSTTTATGSSGSVSSVAYFFSNQFQTIQTSMESLLLRGDRALANDEPVYNTIKNAVWASMRSFSSAPSGEFIAWYPDYWGKAGNDVVMTIDSIELINLKVTQTDSEFFSHVYCTGVNLAGNALQKWNTQGVVSIESGLNALASEAEFTESETYAVSDKVSALLEKILYIPEGEEWKYTPKELYRRYGARPKSADLTNLGSAKLIEDAAETDSLDPTYIMPFLYALYSFMEHWSKQNKVDVEITFNPSIIPGMRIAIEGFDVAFYVSSVSHTMDYSSGFTTSITAICPTGSLVSGMVNV